MEKSRHEKSQMNETSYFSIKIPPKRLAKIIQLIFNKLEFLKIIFKMETRVLLKNQKFFII